jgi:hypothetical protein
MTASGAASGTGRFGLRASGGRNDPTKYGSHELGAVGISSVRS